jgi:hypothetical protein
VGTAIYYDLEEYFDPEWAAVLSHRWSREQIVATAARFSPLVPQPILDKVNSKLAIT